MAPNLLSLSTGSSVVPPKNSTIPSTNCLPAFPKEPKKPAASPLPKTAIASP